MKTQLSHRKFQKIVYDYFDRHGRDLPWRNTNDPYHILVSEVMLQQTQVERTKEKYMEFITAFPTVKSLAHAAQSDVLRIWKGLGYNRRALYLKRAAEQMVSEHGGAIPESEDDLKKLPGIGPATAASIAAFAFNSPTVFIETNIRAVYIHFFFNEEMPVDDKDIRTLVERTLDRDNPRRWYSALMDYGTTLKKHHPNPSRRSAHHTVQSRFEGSDRQVRGKILEILLKKSMGETNLLDQLGIDKDRFERILAHLIQEGFIERKGDIVTLK